jgi:hypothetical protein
MRGGREMSDFALIDLYAQRKEVLAYVQGWNTAEILDWMSQYGTVIELTSRYEDKLYRFTSRSGDHTAFRLSEDEGLVILHPR